MVYKYNFVNPSCLSKSKRHNMLVLYESSCGYSLFKVSDESKLEKPDSIYKAFATPEKAAKV